LVVKKKLEEKLGEKGLTTEQQLDYALSVQQRTGELLNKMLTKMNLLTEEELNVNLGDEKLVIGKGIDEQLLGLVPIEVICKYKVFPVRQENDRLYVAMADPMNVVALDDLRFLTGYNIEPLSASEKEIKALIEKYFGIPEVEHALQELLAAEEDVEYKAKTRPVEESKIDDAPVIRLVNSLLIKAVEKEASDIHIEPFELGVRVRYRIDGILHTIMNLPSKMIFPVVSRIKIMANMDISERRLPQDGRISIQLAECSLDLRISTVPTVYGEKVVIRILNKETIKNCTLNDLGFSQHNFERFSCFLNSSYGMVLVTGPTGSGKTTTLYTALMDLNSEEKNIITVEDPVEYMLDGINQTQINTRVGITFATYLRSILRQDPDIIFIGEIRDLETAEIAVRAANTGHLVLSTMHTNNAPGAIIRLLDMGVEPFMVASSVLGVVAQRLVRRICDKCKQRYIPTEMEMSFAGLKSGAYLYAGEGCENCNYTGYRGRIAIQEVLTVTPALQNLILKRAALDELRQLALQEGMISLKEDGIEKVLDGITTIKEVMRVAFREDE
jgi:type IV pilus assembly protein PilB